MNQERKKVLEMLASGKITAEEADQLLEKLSGAQAEEPAQSPGNGNVLARLKERLKFLCVKVEDGEDEVNIRVPLALIRSGLGIAALMPASASAKLNASGIDLSELAGDAVVWGITHLDM